MDAVELVSVTTADGVALHGALCHGALGHGALGHGASGHGTSGHGTSGHGEEPSAGSAERAAPETLPKLSVDAIVTMHGVGGSYYSGKLFPPLVERLRSHNCPVLLANNRGHDGVYTASRNGKACRLGAAYECVDDCRHDLRAWLELLAARGFGRIALVGHSLGAIKVVYAQAKEKFSAVTALVSLSAPSLSYQRFMNSAKRADFEADLADARALLDANRGKQLFETRVPFPMLLAAEAYLDKYGPDERYEVIGHAAQLECRSLFMYGENELAAPTDAFRDVPNYLRNQANAKALFDIEVVPGGDHFYTGRQSWLAERIARWLAIESRP